MQTWRGLVFAIAEAEAATGISFITIAGPSDLIGQLGRRCRQIQNPQSTAGYRGVQETKDSARYAKIVAWSDEDHCYIGYVPGLLIGECCHGDDEKAVFAELCEIVDETIELDRMDGLSLPPPTAGFDYCDILQDAVKSHEAAEYKVSSRQRKEPPIAGGPGKAC